MHAARFFEQHLGGLDPALVLLVGQHARQHFRRFHGKQDARTGLEDLLLLRRVQQHHGVDDQVRRLQGALGRQVAGQCGVSAVGGHVVAHRLRMIEGRQLDGIDLGLQTLRGIHRRTHGTRVGIVALEHGDALRLVHAGQLQYVLEHLGQFAIANRHLVFS
ncbi:hypothetical protein FQZ97_739750 [compost metagenome]